MGVFACYVDVSTEGFHASAFQNRINRKTGIAAKIKLVSILLSLTRIGTKLAP